MPGVCLMTATAFSAFNTVGFLNGAVQAKAVVIGLYYVETAEGGGYDPIVRFVDALGVEHIAKGAHGAWDFFIQPFSRNLPSVGDEIDIMYDTDNPEGDFWTTSNVWSNTYLLLAASVGFTAFGLLLIKINADFESKRKMN